jgi:hypothetical protein
MAKGNRPRWTPTGVKDGVEEVHIRKWNYFIDYVQDHFPPGSAWIFRGHRKDSYKLESTIDREISDKGQTTEIRQKQLERFKLAVRGKRGANPPNYEDEKEWWSLGQHFGLLTPLLDWTRSPYTAAYFAFLTTGSDDSKRRVVIALNKEVAQHNGLNNELEFFVPTSDENARVISQNGLFTYTRSGRPIEELVAEKFPGATEAVVRKIILPNDEREPAIAGLELMNINHLTLFPDLHGASIYSNTGVYAERNR